MKKEIREFETGATRNLDESKLDYEGFLPPKVLKAYAEYMHKHRLQANGKLRDSDNWQKGIPKDAYMKSMFRHFVDVWTLHRQGGGFIENSDGEEVDLEDTLTSLMFNVMGYLHEELKTKYENSTTTN